MQEERDLLRRDELGRHDEVALVLTVLVVDDDHDLAAADRRDRILDLGESHLLASLPFEQSFDILRGHVDLEVHAPAHRLPSVVTSTVCGITATVNPSSSTSTMVRLIPSTVIEPFSTT